jgi:hypothetical protein
VLIRVHLWLNPVFMVQLHKFGIKNLSEPFRQFLSINSNCRE